MPTPAEADRPTAVNRRGQSAQSRLAAADVRDEIAAARDLAARARDRADVARNIVQARLDAAQDREQSARERLHALVDRELLAGQLAIAETDPLTGARTRSAGLLDLDRELERCRRTAGPLSVAYVDVVGLKSLNDSEGHRAGDELLQRVVAMIRVHLRPYDLVIRLGGDEFLVAMSNMTVAGARVRFSVIAAALASAPDAGAISAGFAELAPADTSASLIARADGELIGVRRAHPDSRPVSA